MTTHDTIGFPDGETGSSLLRGALAQAVAVYPAVFDGIDVPDDLRRFKRGLSERLVAFEARRAAATERVEIARELARFVRERTWYGRQPLAEALRAVGSTPARHETHGGGRPGWTPEITLDGRTWRGPGIGDLADHLQERHQLSAPAADALRWIAREHLGSPLVLDGHRFALLGAGAELAPTPYLLQAGARVVWVDRAAPAVQSDTPGTLVWDPEASDLLGAPARILGVLNHEASLGELHAGLYAYAPGRGRELLLTASMNGLVEALGPASAGLLVSPTTPGEIDAGCQAARHTRQGALPWWQRALAGAGVLATPSFERHGDVEISKAIVALQGPTYQAAQYLTKMMTAEAWSVEQPGMGLSANVAGITRTRSLEHPLFLAAFRGAPQFGVTIFESEQTRTLMTLLWLHDLLHPEAVGPSPGEPGDGATAAERARRIVAKTVHGGVRSTPFVLDHTIRIAALLGLGQEPRLLMRLARGR